MRKRRQTRAEWFRLYSVYLSSDLWKSKRLIVLTRCNEKCEVCLFAKATQVHHTKKAYAFMRRFGFGSEPVSRDYLLGICPECHAKEHGRPIGFKNVPKTAKKMAHLIDPKFRRIFGK